MMLMVTMTGVEQLATTQTATAVTSWMNKCDHSDIFPGQICSPSGHWHCLFGDRNGIWPVSTGHNNYKRFSITTSGERKSREQPNLLMQVNPEKMAFETVCI